MNSSSASLFADWRENTLAIFSIGSGLLASRLSLLLLLLVLVLLLLLDAVIDAGEDTIRHFCL